MLTTAVTVVLDRPAAMAVAARRIAEAPLIKVKVDATEPRAAIEAVASAAPGARLIVDPNESWSFELLEILQPFLRDARFLLLELPMPVVAIAGALFCFVLRLVAIQRRWRLPVAPVSAGSSLD